MKPTAVPPKQGWCAEWATAETLANTTLQGMARGRGGAPALNKVNTETCFLSHVLAPGVLFLTWLCPPEQ